MKIGNLQRSLVEEGLDGFIAFQNAHYLAETDAAGAVVVTREKPILICVRMELDRAEAESRIGNVRAYSKSEIPLRKGEEVTFDSIGVVIGEILSDLDLKKIGYDYLKEEVFEELQKTHEADYRKNKDLIWRHRKKKTRKEIINMKKAAEIATVGMRKAEEVIEPGLTEIEVAAEVEYEMRKLGSQGTPFDTIIAGGENSIFPHTQATEKVLEEEEIVTVDIGARWKGYASDMTRTFSISPNREQEKIIKIVKKAKKTSLESVESGVKASEIDEIAREVFREDGYEEFYLHSLGHGVGLNVHEPPRLSPSSDDVLGEGMVITIEPGLYVDDVGGCRFEDTVVVKKDGYEKLTGFESG